MTLFYNTGGNWLGTALSLEPKHESDEVILNTL